VTATEARGDSVDDAVSGLRSLQGRESTKTGTSSGTDDQTAALRELRERQREQREAEPDGVVDRVRSLFGSDD
jgi:hypothetical protein